MTEEDFTLTPDASAGDPFVAAGASLERPCICWGGSVFLGRLVTDEDTGEEVEVFERGSCKRCSEEMGEERTWPR